MPGLWSTVSGALDAGKQVLFDETASRQRQQQIDSEQALTQQKIADDKAEQARAQREDAYKASMEKMGALKEQSENVFQEAQPTIAVLNHAQTLKGADRDAYMQTDEYKNAHDAYHGKGGYGERINSLGDQYQQHLSDIAGYHADVAREKAPQTAFDIQQYGWGGTRPGDAYDYVSAVSGRPAGDFIQRNGGPSMIEGSIHQLQQGIQAGQIDGLGPQVTALLDPLLNTHKGQRDGAGNIIGQTHVVGISMGPANPGNVILHTAHEMHGADGTTKVQGAPQGEGISVPVQKVMGYIGNLSQMANKVDDPEAQKKLREAEDNGDTAMHRVLQDAGRAGVPLESVYGPQPKREVGAGGLFTIPGPGGGEPTFTPGQKQLTGTDWILDQYVKQGLAPDLASANDLLQKQKKEGKFAPTGKAAANSIETFNEGVDKAVADGIISPEEGKLRKAQKIAHSAGVGQGKDTHQVKRDAKGNIIATTDTSSGPPPKTGSKGSHKALWGD